MNVNKTEKKKNHFCSFNTDLLDLILYSEEKQNIAIRVFSNIVQP